MEGLTFFGGAYVRREICVSKSIGLACSEKEIYHFCFVLPCIRGQIPSTSLPRGLYSEGRFNGGFFALRFWGAYIWRGLYMEGLIFGILRYVSHKILGVGIGQKCVKILKPFCENALTKRDIVNFGFADLPIFGIFFGFLI